MASLGFRRLRTGSSLSLAGILVVLLALWMGHAAAAVSVVCYSVADDGNGSGSGQDSGAEDLLTRIDPADHDPATNEDSIGSGTGTFNVEASTFDPGTDDLFAVDADQLGRVNITTGVFTAKPSSFGSGSGSAGTIAFSDVDSITFDPSTGILYGGARVVGEDPDVLFQIDPATGAHVDSAFGPGEDYVQVTPLANESRLDDLAMDFDGTLYAISNIGGHEDHLVTIDPETGALSDVGPTNVNDMEGLSIAPDGRLFGTTGQESSSGSALWDIDKESGAATNPRALDNANDYESVACLAEGSPEPSPSPSVSVIPTGTETSEPPEAPSVSPTVSATVGGVKVIPETGSGAVPVLFVIGLAFVVGGIAVIRLGESR
ncbi:MAG TPA: hypothetical protein VJ922_04100 [Actinomycetota bacterium]|nr:hypothetical protein [Actinomycetota bacterium]